MPATEARRSFRPPLTLTGRWVELVPVTRELVPALARAGSDPQIWTYVRHGRRDTPEKMAELVEFYLAAQDAGTNLPLVQVRRSDGVPVGMTGYLDIHRPDRGVEIGGTWLDPEMWRTPINTEAKFLLLRHAFETEGCLRVQLKTDLRNTRSQRAIERIGGQREGVLRNHIVMEDGYVRSSVYYSILAEEWPGVKAHLQGLLQRDFRPAEALPRGAPS